MPRRIIVVGAQCLLHGAYAGQRLNDADAGQARESSVLFEGQFLEISEIGDAELLAAAPGLRLDMDVS